MLQKLNFRTRLLLLVLIVALPVVLILGYSYFRQRDRATENSKAQALTYAQLLAYNFEQVVIEARGLLYTVSQIPSIRELDEQNCQDLVADLLSMQEAFAFLGVADLNGHVFCSFPVPGTPISVEDRPYFQRVLQTQDFVIGDYQVGRVTGVPVIAFAYPVYSPSGDLNGAVIASVSLDRFEAIALQADLPVDTSITLLDGQGTILTRYPDAETWVGKSVPELPLVETILEQGLTGTAEGEGLDGELRLFGVEVIDGDSTNQVLYLAIGMPYAEAFSDVAAISRNALFAIIVSFLFLGAGAWFGSDLTVVRPLRKVRETMQALASGDLSARSNLTQGDDEIGLIVGSFNQMAETLEQRELERDRASRATSESERRYRSLFNKIQEGFALHEIMCDEQGEPIDYRFLEVNPAFEELTGLKATEAVGKTVLEVLPGTERHWIETYGRVALTGEPIRFENYAGELGKYFEVVAFSPNPDQFATLFVDITEQRKTEENIERQLKRLRSLREIDMAIAGSVDRQITFSIILGEVLAELHVDAASILLFNEATGYLEFAAGKGFHNQGIERSRVRLGMGYSGKAAQNREITHADDLINPSSDYQRSELLEGEDFVAYWGAPLVAKGKLLGVLEVYTRKPIEPDKDWISFFELLAGQTAIALDSTLLFEGLESKNQELAVAYETTLEGWAKALELRDDETEGHTQRVTELSLELASTLGLGGKQLVSIRRGALLHDIGKIGVPDHILLKPGPLNEEEWEVMRQHPVYARELLNSIPYLADALDIPYCHHEKWDGSGYPENLSGDDIPFAARIFSVVDVWDALLSNRPYRKAWSSEEAVKYIREQSGKHFDPKVVEVFFRFGG